MQHTNYISGSTAERITENRIEKPLRREQKRQRRISQKTANLTAFRLPQVIVSGLLAVVCLQFSIQYIRDITEVNSLVTQIESIQSEVESKNENNRLLKSELNAAIDLDEVYRVATEEIGMIYPDEGSIISYTSVESEYVRQFDSVPD